MLAHKLPLANDMITELQQDVAATSSASLMSLDSVNFDPSLGVGDMDQFGSFVGFETYSQDLLFGFMNNSFPIQDSVP